MENVASSFSQQRLAELRAAGYRPAAWAHLLRASWWQARQTAHAHPHLVRDWWRLAAVLGVLPLGLAAGGFRRGGAGATVRRTWPLVVVTTTQLGDIYVHLGLHRQEKGAIHPTLGPAMLLTAIRGWVGGWLLTRFVQHQPLSDAEVALALAAILLTDLVDGPLARHTARASALGRYLDGEADIVAWTALTLTQARQGQVPWWFVGVFALRWGMPMLVGFGRTFAHADPVVVAPTGLGRVAGAAQVALALTGLLAARQAGQPHAQRWQRGRDGLALATAGLFGAATLLHLRRMIRQ